MNDQTAEFGIQVYYFLIKGQIDSEFNLCHLFCIFVSRAGNAILTALEQSQEAIEITSEDQVIQVGF